MISKQQQPLRSGRRPWLALALTAALLTLGGAALVIPGSRPAVSAPGQGASARGPAAAPRPRARPLGRRGCVPNCRGKACGDDGCGGDCGKCGKDRACLDNKCVAAPRGNPCKAMAGTWAGLMPATRTHSAQYLRGRIWLQGKACRAKFDITYRRNARAAQVVEYFDVVLSGPKKARRATFTCTKLVYVRQRTSYSKDNFTGRLDITHTVFRGKVIDTAGATGAILLKKK